MVSRRFESFGSSYFLTLKFNNMEMTIYDACSIIEGFCGYEPEEQEVLNAFQFLLDTGLVWQMQGFYGRTAVELIEAGLITPKK